jgi:hypothetical protein
MVIDFYNKNVPNAQFKICWGNEQCTPIFSLKAGATGSYDLTFSHSIQPGTQCRVYAWDGMIDSFNKAITFTYEKGKKMSEAFNFFINDLTQKADLKKIDRSFKYRAWYSFAQKLVKPRD